MQGDYDNSAKEAEAKRRQHLRKRYSSRSKRNIIGTPPPVKGRKHETIQTEKYLEELLAKPLENDVDCQTDMYLYEIPMPNYEPNKTGVDASTCIDDDELIEFDHEVQPLIETLIGMTIQQAVQEVMHEEELAELRKEQQRYLDLRDAELEKFRALEANELELIAEHDRRTRLEQIAKQLDSEMNEKITAARLLENYVDALLPDILKNIQDQLQEKNLVDINDKVRPWLAKEVTKEIGDIIDSREILEEIVREIVDERADNLR